MMGESNGSVSPRTSPTEDVVAKPPAKKRTRKSTRKMKNERCKNPECSNQLSGRQRAYCSPSCKQKMWRKREEANKKKRSGK